MNKKKILISLLSVMIIASFTMAVSSCSSGGGKGEGGETKNMSYEITDVRFVHRPDSTGEEDYFGIVEITNTGDCGIYMKDCTFDLEDDDGHLLQTDKYIHHCPDVIAPGEKGYFYNEYDSIDKSVSLENGIKLVPNVTLVEATGSDEEMFTEYVVSDTDLREGDYRNLKFTGRVANNTSDDESFVTVNVILYDSEGKVLWVGGQTVTDFNANSKQTFEYTTHFRDAVELDDVAEYKTICRRHYNQFK